MAASAWRRICSASGYWAATGHSHGPGESDHDHDHDHGHGHAERDHDHCRDEASAAERGQIDGAASFRARMVDGVDLFPEAAVARYNNISNGQAGGETPRHISFTEADAQRDSARGSKASMAGRPRGRSASARHSRITSIDDISIHPASFRQEIIAASRSRDIEEEDSEDSITESPAAMDEPGAGETTPLLPPNLDGSKGDGEPAGHHYHRSLSRRPRRDSTGLHSSHHHNKPKKNEKAGHGHSHADMGMNAMVLHVAGDALGNIGVIVTALFIWQSTSPYRWYADPVCRC